MTHEELEVEVKSLKQQMLTIASRTSERDGKTESGLSNVSVKTDTLKTETEQNNVDIDEVAITMADFMAEYYLSQFEGGEEE